MNPTSGIIRVHCHGHELLVNGPVDEPPVVGLMPSHVHAALTVDEVAELDKAEREVGIGSGLDPGQTPILDQGPEGAAVDIAVPLSVALA